MKKDEVEYTKKRYVAMLDIMGFQSIVEKKRPRIVYKLLDKVYTEIKRQNDIENLNISMFSDTIIIVSEDDSMNSYENIVLSSAIFVNLFIEYKYAINGVIAFGDTTFDDKKNICFGKPIIDAHLMQEKLFFYGIVLHKTANNRRREYKEIPFFNYQLSDFVIDLNIPLKKEGWVQMYCVNWCEVFSDDNAKQIPLIKEQIRELYKSSKKSERGIYYVMNTEIVLKQWYDFTANKNTNFDGWGSMISEEEVTKCPYVE